MLRFKLIHLYDEEILNLLLHCVNLLENQKHLLPLLNIQHANLVYRHPMDSPIYVHFIYSFSIMQNLKELFYPQFKLKTMILPLLLKVLHHHKGLAIIFHIKIFHLFCMLQHRNKRFHSIHRQIYYQ